MTAAAAITHLAGRSRKARARTTALGLALLVMGVAGAARAADHTLTDVTLEMGPFKVIIPKIELRGTPLDLPGATSLFDLKSSETAVARLSRLNAATILIPELHLDQDIAGQQQRTTYKDTTASEIVAGRIGKMATAVTTSVTKDPTLGLLSQTVGLTSAEGVDLTVGARFLTEAAKPGQKAEFETLYKSYDISDYTMDLGDLGTVKVASIKGRDARVRQGTAPALAGITAFLTFAERQNAATAKGDKAEVPGKDDLQAMGKLFEILENFEYGDIDATGSTATIKIPEGPLDLRIARMFFSDKANKGEFRLDGFDLKGGPVKAALGSFSATGFSFANTIRAFTEALQSSNIEAALAANPMKYIPKLGSIKTSALMIEAPVDTVKDAAGKPEIQKLGLRASEVTIGAQKDGIPTAIKVSLDGLTLPISARDKREGLTDLLALGYRAVDLSMALEGAWAEAKNEFAISNVSLSGVDMGRITLSGLLGNITRDVFSGDPALAQVALLGAAARKLDIKVEDKGLFARVLERQAKAKKKSVEDLRKEFGTIAAVGLPAMLGPSEGAKAIAGALSRFIAKPGTLTLSASAKSPSGLGLADVIAVSDPSAIFEKLDVKASAE